MKSVIQKSAAIRYLKFNNIVKVQTRVKSENNFKKKYSLDENTWRNFIPISTSRCIVKHLMIVIFLKTFLFFHWTTLLDVLKWHLMNVYEIYFTTELRICYKDDINNVAKIDKGKTWQIMWKKVYSAAFFGIFDIRYSSHFTKKLKSL